MRALLLFAEDKVGAIEGWFRLAGGHVLARGQGEASLPAPDEEERIIRRICAEHSTVHP